MRRKRRLTRGEIKKRNKKVIFSGLLILCLLSVGYGAFQTSLRIDVTGKIKIPTECVEGKVWEFTQKNEVQEFKVPCSGEYKLETWGASGGDYDSTYVGGYGGYSSGNINLKLKQKIYIVVGGHPLDNSTKHTYVEGGYNGGGGTGTRIDLAHNAGGGATHIALDSGLLKDLSLHINDDRIFIVSGGGGGGTSPIRAKDANNNYFYRTSGAGSAGGYIGNDATTSCTNCDCESIGTGGTQTAGGNRIIISYNLNINSSSYNNYDENFPSGTFGLGSSGDNIPTIRPEFDKVGGSGGGGGYYGGSGNSCVGAGGGGSSYIGNTLLTNKSMYCYDCEESIDLTKSEIFTISTTGNTNYRDTLNCPDGFSENPISKCAKKGDGFAKITLLTRKPN